MSLIKISETALKIFIDILTFDEKKKLDLSFILLKSSVFKEEIFLEDGISFDFMYIEL